MPKNLRWVIVLGGMILIGNFVVLRLFGDALQSTYLFVTRGTVFFPLAYLNLIVGVLLLALLIWDVVGRRKK